MTKAVLFDLDGTLLPFVAKFENSCFRKPNPAYYQDILGKLNLAPEECLMVGNDVTEDMVAMEAFRN